MVLLSGLVSQTRSSYAAVRQAVVEAAADSAEAAPAMFATGYRIAKDYASSTIFFVAPTPYEYEEQTWKKAEHGEDSCAIEWVPSPIGAQYVQRQLALPPVPPGHVRVKVYHTLDSIYEDSALWDDVPLRDGVLNLFYVRKRFGLQNCTPIDSGHCKLLRPFNPNVIPYSTLHILMDNQYCLRVMELPSPGCRFFRKLRYNIRYGCKQAAGLSLEALSWLVIALFSTAMLMVMLVWNILKTCFFSCRGLVDSCVSSLARFGGIARKLVTELRPVTIWVGVPLLLWYTACGVLAVLFFLYSWLAQSYPEVAMAGGMVGFCAAMVILAQSLPQPSRYSSIDY